MAIKSPPFDITNKIIQYVAEISELVAKLTYSEKLSSNPTLRRTNLIRTIQGSLAIEQNTLTVEQITALLNGKRVIAPPKDIAEVKNAYEIYEHMENINPYDENSLLKAHGVMMKGLIEEAGMFRTKNIGVVNKDGEILHFGTLPQYVPNLINELLEWTEKSDMHMLIKSCVFHYEFELIHPFADGNGRMGRLWHTLLLSKWKGIFAHLPVESIIHDRQQEYYDAINMSNSKGKSTDFIEFMLSAIKEALCDATGEENAKDNSEDEKWLRISKFIEENEYIMNTDIRNMFGVSSATASRMLNRLSSEGKLERVRVGSHWGYMRKVANVNCN